MTQYVEALGLSQDAQYFIDVVGEKFLKTVFADSEVLKISASPKDELRLSESVVERLMANLKPFTVRVLHELAWRHNKMAAHTPMCSNGKYAIGFMKTTVLNRLLTFVCTIV